MKDGRELSGDELPVQQVMARGTEVRENEFDLVCEDGTVRTLFGNATPLRDDKGNVRGSIGAFVDVTERRRMEARLRDQAQELERANRIKDDFLATLGHELRTPLNAIVGWSSMLLRGGLGEDVVRRAHESIARNAEAQRTLIEDVLDVSRIVSGNLRLDLRQVDVAAPVRAALDCVRQLADEKAVVIRAEFDDRPAPTVGDSARLQQVFLNLLSNAVKFTRSGGHIRVALDRSGPDVRVRVQDDGVGIPGELLPHVFERFRQADSSSRRKNTGLGLGLAIVRQLTELHGGRVMAESAGEGQGATFTVLLPLRPFHERRHVSAPPPRWETSITPVPAATPSLCGARVLVVDDHKDARDLASSVLQESGASVHVAASARQALDEVGAADPDVLVIDISMPDVDGYDLLRAIRNGTSRAAHAPAIAFTAYAREEDRRRALATGFQRHLAKPVEADALVRAVASVWQGGESPGSA
jgi:signal transduction histidine kinase/CheY-like chemotaxis protein